MKKYINQPYSLTLFVLCLHLSACMNNPRVKRDGASSDEAVVNTSASVELYYGRILKDNPIILSGDPELEAGVDLNRFLTFEQTFISDRGDLTGSCYQVSSTPNCFSSQLDENADPLTTSDGKWAFDANTSEFLQVHTFGHMEILLGKFLTSLKNIYEQADPTVAPGVELQYKTSIPNDLFSKESHWNPENPTLKSYTECDVKDNAYFDATTFSLCFGQDSQFQELKMAQDPTVIYHEIGHSLIKTMLNARNIAGDLTFRSDLGLLRYDEAGSIGEGVSDYFSYYVNERTHFGEWAFGRYNFSSRPLTETDPLHIPGLSDSIDSRLSYPQYLFYDPFLPKVKVEDVHTSGQIISHFLVALTEDIKSKCNYTTTSEAIEVVMRVMVESFSELGDLTAKGSDHSLMDTINLNSDWALKWQSQVRPIDFRSFSQRMAKYLKIIFGDETALRCNGTFYSSDSIEQLLDMYGLLLFENYNEDGNGSDIDNTTGKLSAHSGEHTKINPLNRINSVMMAKEFLDFSSDTNDVKYIVADDRASIINAIRAMQANGQIGGVSELFESDLPFNNSNGIISPGEIVGVAFNLFNHSNSDMAGIRVLANDWDHTKEGKGCNNLGNDFPSLAEGAADSSTESGDGSVGDCLYTTRSQGDDNDLIMPICMVQLNDDDSTRWGLQDELRQKLNLDSKQCLGGEDNLNDCFVRAIKGADMAYYSKINANSNWNSTVANQDEGQKYDGSNFIFLEVSPWIPPKTEFVCRFRATFNNCSDCHQNGDENEDDFADYLYSGHRPFKILDLQFTVID